MLQALFVGMVLIAIAAWLVDKALENSAKRMEEETPEEKRERIRKAMLQQMEEDKIYDEVKEELLEDFKKQKLAEREENIKKAAAGLGFCGQRASNCK